MAVAGPSEELLDLFGSIEGLRQEMAALPDPHTLSPSASQDQEGSAEDQVRS